MTAPATASLEIWDFCQKLEARIATTKDLRDRAAECRDHEIVKTANNLLDRMHQDLAVWTRIYNERAGR